MQQTHVVQIGERDAAQVGVDRVREAREVVDVLEQVAHGGGDGGGGAARLRSESLGQSVKNPVNEAVKHAESSLIKQPRHYARLPIFKFKLSRAHVGVAEPTLSAPLLLGASPDQGRKYKIRRHRAEPRSNSATPTTYL